MTRSLRTLLFPAFAVAVLAGHAVSAQTLPTAATPAVSVSFAADGSQGGNPYDNVIQASDGNIYGANECGGNASSGYAECAGNLNSSAGGAIFRITPAGVLSLVHSFSGSDGAVPDSLIQLPDGNLYGIAVWGGANGYGTIYEMSLTGANFTILYNFANSSDGANPIGRIVYGSDGYIYGTTTQFANGGSELGTLWRYQVSSKQFSTLYHFGQNGVTLGENPYGGVTKIGTKLYGTSQNVGGSGYGTLWYVDSTNDAGTLLHTFTNGVDGANPLSAPRLDGDGFLYGTTQAGRANGIESGTVYQAGQTSGFTNVESFPQNTQTFPDGGVTFDNSGYLYTTAEMSGANNAGQLLDISYVDSEPATNTLYSFAPGDGFGSNPASAPFLDNQGRMWTEQLFGDGTTDPFGGVAAFTLTPALAAPITITATPVTVQPKTNVSIAWAAHNVFSDDEKICFATSTPTSTWSGVQDGTFANKTYSGSKTVAFTTTGDYALAITCGGFESALTTVHVRYPSATTLTASANPVAAGASETLTVKVTGNGSAATGIVTVSVNGVAVGTINVANSSTLALSTTGLTAGTYTVTASYPGDLQYTASTATLSLKVTGGSGPVATTTTLTAVPNPVAIGTNLVLTGTVKKSSGTGTPTGSVSFKLGTTVLATVTLNGNGAAVFTVPTSGLVSGTYPITASYAGDAGDSASNSTVVNVVVTAATSKTVLVITPNPQKIGGNVTFKATVTGGGPVPTGSVMFEFDGNTLSTATLSGGVASATFPTSGLPAGTYTLTAVYGGDSAHSGSTSAPASVTLTN